ncbi:MAG: hypothetical protein VXA41_05065 [Euryarchaeota archaeon]
MNRITLALLLTTLMLTPLVPIAGADAHGIPDDLDPYDGWATLEIHDPVVANSNITATWTLNFSISDYHGTEQLIHPTLGIRKQIDFYLGNGDDYLNQSEIDLFTPYLQNRVWNNSERAGCCMLDHEAFEPTNITIIANPPSPGPVMFRNGSWGWTEIVELTGTTDGRSTRLLDLPRTGAGVEEVPLTIILPSPYEYRYSAMSEVIEGSPGEFTVNRSAVPVASDIRISLGENSPPNILANRLTGSTQLALDRSTTYEVNCVDSHLDDTEIYWTFSNNGSVVSGSDQPFVSITPSEHNFTHGDVLSTVVRCTDDFGASSEWFENIVIDGESPTWEASFVAQSTENGDVPIDVNDGIIEIGSEDILQINISASDESGLDTSIEIISNRSSEWRHIDWNQMFAQSRFPQGDNVNNMNLEIDNRHQSKPATTYSLHLKVVDDAGNSVHHDWVILVLDGAGPTILPDIYSNDVLISAEHPVRADEPILVNLSNSYDDLDAIEDTRWTFILNQEAQFENQSFADIETFEIDPLEAGSHWFILMSWDSKDNMNMLSFSIAVQPAPGVNISIWNVSYDGTPTIGETIELYAVVQNIGGDSAVGRLCSGALCSDYTNIPWATSIGPGVVGISLVIPLERAGELPLRLEWEDSEQKDQSIVIDSDIMVNSDSGPLQVILGVFLVLAGLAIGARMLWGPQRFED